MAKTPNTQTKNSRTAIFEKAAQAVRKALAMADKDDKMVVIYLRPNGRLIFTAHPLDMAPIDSPGDEPIACIYPGRGAQDMATHLDYLQHSVELAAQIMEDRSMEAAA